MNIVLVGNPNVGKSVIFNALTGRYVTVSNYPGTSVEIAKGAGKFGGQRYAVIDTPGVNSLTPHSEDERITTELLSESGTACIVQVADSKNLKRSLMLALELIEMKMPLVIDLNMTDEAKARGLSIDTKKLSDLLGVDIVETVAVTGEGIGRLKEAIPKARVPSLKDENLTGPGGEISSLKKRARLADAIIKKVLRASNPLEKRVSETVGRLTIRPLSGIPILILVIGLMYLFVGKFAAGTVVNFLEEGVFDKFVNPFFKALIGANIQSAFIRDFLVGDYGIITMACTYAFGIIFPIVTAFFLFFGILEDSGYLPRLSVLSDRLFKVIGLNGRAILPMVLGLGCGTMAVLTSRILDTKKERMLVTLLLTLAIPCSAQLGVIMGMLGGVSLKALGIWLAVIFSVMMLVGYVAAKITPGAASHFIQEIPPIRMPQAANLAWKTLARLKWYLKEAVPLFVLATILLFLADKTGLLKWIEELSSPLVVKLLNLPEKATDAFVMGFLRRDYGVAGLYAMAKSGALDNIQILVSAVVITLFVPCIAQLIVTIKERGVKAGCLIGGFVFIFAFLFGGALNLSLRFIIFKLGIPVI